jgi:uncharacterized protein YjaG (DUF416 family)
MDCVSDTYDFTHKSKEDCKQILKDLERLEKLEKVIEIIKAKRVAVSFLLNTLCLKEYNLSVLKENELSQEEYELLKEIFAS